MFDTAAYAINAHAASLEAPRLSEVRLERAILNAQRGALRGVTSSIGRLHGLTGQVEDYRGTTVSVVVGRGKAVHGATINEHGVDVRCGAGVVRHAGTGTTYLSNVRSAAGADVTCKRCLK